MFVECFQNKFERLEVCFNPTLVRAGFDVELEQVFSSPVRCYSINNPYSYSVIWQWSYIAGMLMASLSNTPHIQACTYNTPASHSM